MDKDEQSPASFNLASRFIHLDDGGAATSVPVDEEFWSNMDPRFDRGRMVALFRSDDDWPNWEMHPAGDEVIHILSGRMTLILQHGDRMTRLEAGPGQTVIVPTGTWHTADIHEPGEALFITPGAGTERRAREIEPG